MEIEANNVESNGVGLENQVQRVRRRVYDSKDGKTCHQCRQKTTIFSASCKREKKKGVFCTVKMCKKCLKNRYGEDAEEMDRDPKWWCPKCRDKCNCSLCMKRKGFLPTGILAPTAKEFGFGSVSDLLSERGLDCRGLVKDPVVDSPIKRGKENSVDGSSDVDMNATLNPDEQEKKKMKRAKLKEICNGSRADGAAVSNNGAKGKAKIVQPHRRRVKECTVNIEEKEVDLDLPLPQGTPLTTVMGIELAPEDVGNALQLLEFSKNFGEVLTFPKSQAESVLRELSRAGSGRSGRPGQYSSVIRFHTRLLFIIQEDTAEEPPSLDQASNNNAWFLDLGKCISKSGVSEFDGVLKELPSDCFSRGGDGYDALNFSQKLGLLNVLCDQALCTNTLRSWMESQHAITKERKTEASKKVTAAKRKENGFDRQLKEQAYKRPLDKNDPVAIAERASTVSQLQSEKTQAHVEVLEAESMLAKEKQAPNVLRTAPYSLDADGRAFWKLKGHSSEDEILLQDMGTWDGVADAEKWFAYGAETKEPIEKYISALTLKAKKAKRAATKSENKPSSTPESSEEGCSETKESSEESMEVDNVVMEVDPVVN